MTKAQFENLIEEMRKPTDEDGFAVKEYIRDIIHTFTTGDDKTDKENIEMIVETVSKFTGKPQENI